MGLGSSICAHLKGLDWALEGMICHSLVDSFLQEGVQLVIVHFVVIGFVGRGLNPNCPLQASRAQPQSCVYCVRDESRVKDWTCLHYRTLVKSYFFYQYVLDEKEYKNFSCEIVKFCFYSFTTVCSVCIQVSAESSSSLSHHTSANSGRVCH